MVEALDEREAVPRHDMWMPEPPTESADDKAEAEEVEQQPDPEAWELQPAESKLADVLLYLLQLADKLGLDLTEEARKKLEANPPAANPAAK